MNVALPKGPGVPQELIECDRWVLWTLEDRGGPKPTKVPRQASGAMASSTNPATWSSFDQVSEAIVASPDHFAGLGLVIAPPYIGIDLDGCRDPKTGIIEDWAKAIISRLRSYTELSPTETGVHIWVRGTLATGGRRKGRVEMYDDARYFTMTGNWLDGTPATIEDRQVELDALHPELFAPTRLPESRPVPARIVHFLSDDAQLLEKARSAGNGQKFTRLYDHGDTREYADGTNAGHSEADLALCTLLSFWTARDGDRVDRLFRGSALMRDKWDEVRYRSGQTYGQHTIEVAIANSGAYDPDSRAPEIGPTVGRDSAHRAVLDTAVEPFPVDALPAAFVDFAREGAASKGCPVEFYALPLLVIAGAAIGNSYELALKEDFIQGSNLFGAVIGDPGTGKSPALSDVVRPLELAQKARYAVYQEALDEYQKTILERDDRRKGDRGERPVEPVMRDVLTTNATVEAQVSMLGRHNGLLNYVDELSGLMLGMNQYKGGKGADRQFYLSAWSRGFIANHRKKAGDTTVVDRPHLSVLGGIQPDLLGTMQISGDDGFLDRFLWVMPDAQPMRWSATSAPQSTRDRVQSVIERLLDGSDMSPLVVRLSPEALAIWGTWYDSIGEERKCDGFPQRLKGPWSKLTAQAARIALILHACDDGGEVMAASMVERAIALTSCLASHTRKVYAHISSNHRSFELRILEAIPAQGRIAQSTLLHKVFHGRQAVKLKEALDNLRESGVLEQEVEKTAGRPATYWRRL